MTSDRRRKEIEALMIEGETACDAGKRITSCPYTAAVAIHSRTHWEQGYRNAQYRKDVQAERRAYDAGRGS
jgi:ribosome modulation factor